MKKILHIAQNHQPQGNRIERMINCALDAGYRVDVLSKPGSSSWHENLELLDAPVFGNVIKRLAIQPKILVLAARSDADIIQLHNPENMLLALILKAIGRNVVYDVHENFGKRIEMRGTIPIFLRPLIALVIVKLEKLVGKYCDAVFVTQAEVQVRIGPSALVINNAAEVSKIDAIVAQRDEALPDAEVYLGYLGTISRHRGLLRTLDLLLKLREKYDVRLLLVGESVDDTIENAKQHLAWKYVDHLGKLSHIEAVANIKVVQIGLAWLDDIGDHAEAFPTKLYEYMAAGIPFLASDFPRWRSIIDDPQIGNWVDVDDLEGAYLMCDRILSDQALATAQREHQYKFAKTHSWIVEAKKVLKAYETIMSEDSN